MPITITINESDASLRCVPIWCVKSNGTSAATNESGRTFFFSLRGVDYGSGGSLSVISADAGLYSCNFSASKVSVLGQGQVYYSSGTALPISTPFMVIPTNSWDSLRLGLFALPNAAAEAAGGLVTLGTGTGQLSVSNGSVGLKAQTHSQATVGGADNLGRREYSDITLRLGLVDYSGATVGAGNIKPGSYSGVSVEVKTGGIQSASVGAGTYSSVTIQGLSNYANISSVTLNAGTHSGATIQGVSRLNSSVTLNADTHSGATIGGVGSNGIVAGSIAAGAITSAKFAAGAIDAVALATDASQEIADALLGRNIAGGSSSGRIVSEALYPLRNRVQIEGSTVTVYQTDDATSAWTGTITTGTNPISGVDPGGP